MDHPAHPPADRSSTDDSGLQAFDSTQSWAILAAVFTALFAVYGVAYSFGAFFKPMVAEFGRSMAETSIVFSITVFLWSMLGLISGHLSDRFGPKRVLRGGALVMGAGLVLTSRIDRLWIGYITYGVGVGVGVASAYVPLVATVGGWFMRRRNMALGIAVAGIGCGIVCVAPIAAMLIQWLGWRATYVVFGAVSAAIMLGCSAIVEQPPVHASASRLDVGEAVRAPAFGLLYLSTALLSIALFVPFVYLPAFAREYGAGPVAAAALISLIGGASVAGRMGLGALGDRMNVVRLYQVSFLLLALSYVVWLFAGSYVMLVIFTIIMGVGYGGYVALGPAILSHMFGTRRLGTILGALYTSTGCGALLGPPIAGVIIDNSGGYRWAIGFAFAAASASFAVLIPLERHAAAERDRRDSEPTDGSESK